MHLSSIVGMKKIVFTRDIAVGTRIITLWIDNTKNVLGSFDWVEYTGAELGIFEKNCDVFKEDFDDREFYLLTGRLPVEFDDIDLNIGRMIIDDTCKRDELLIEYDLRRWGESTFTRIFEGYINQENYIYNPSAKNVQVEFAPKSDVLNKSACFIGGAWNNLLGASYVWADNPIVHVQTLVEDIYKIIDPDIVVEFEQNWTFKVEIVPGPIIVEKDFSLLYVRLRGLFTDIYDNPNTYDTYMKVLKALAFDLGCFTGLVSQKKAVFKIYLDRIATPQTVPTINILKDKYVRKIVDNEIKLLTLSATELVSASAGTATGLPQDEIVLNIYANVYRISYGADWYTVGYIKNPIIAYDVKEEFLLSYWSRYYLIPAISFKDESEFIGTTISIFDDVTVEGVTYRVLELTRDFEKDQTKIIGRPI